MFDRAVSNNLSFRCLKSETPKCYIQRANLDFGTSSFRIHHSKKSLGCSDFTLIFIGLKIGKVFKSNT